MSTRKEKRSGGIQRHVITSHRTSGMRVVPFCGSGFTSHTVRIVDLSVVGAGIESSTPIEHGLACFDESLGGHKLGVVNWCKHVGEKYRAGLNFITLPYDQEQYILDRIMSCSGDDRFGDPDRIIEVLLKSLHQDPKN